MLGEYKITNYPDEIRPLVRKAVRKGRACVKELYSKGYEPSWPEKLTEIAFSYNEKHYSIPYKAFGIKSDDQDMIYSIEAAVKAVFEETGLTCRADGFMD